MSKMGETDIIGESSRRNAAFRLNADGTQRALSPCFISAWFELAGAESEVDQR